MRLIPASASPPPACCAAVWSIRSVTRSVEKMRATSATRSSPSSGSTSVKVRPPEVDLRISSWWSASAAIWAEWVTQITWLVGTDLLKLEADLLGGLAADAGVDLVKDQGVKIVFVGQRALDRQHDPRELAAGGDFRNRAGRLAEVGRDENLSRMVADRRELAGGKGGLHPEVRHLQRPGLFLDRVGQADGGVDPGFGQVVGQR